MRKKLQLTLLATLSLFSFAACGAPKNTEPAEPTKAVVEPSQDSATTPVIQEEEKEEVSSQPSTVITESSTEQDPSLPPWIDSMPEDYVPPVNDPLPEGLEYTLDALYGPEITGYHGTATEITLPRVVEWVSIRKIGDYAFQNNTTLKSVTIPDNHEYIYGFGIFSNCSNLEEVHLPNDLTTLPYEIFSGCTSLKTVTLPETITHLTGLSFTDCSSLESITLPEGVNYIGPYAFKNCSSLRHITIPEKVSELTGQTFWGCSSLESVDIRGQLTTLGMGTFTNCKKLKSISFAEGLTSIGSIAFSGCTDLSIITLPESVESIAFDAFDKCPFLTFEVKEGSYAHQFAVSNGIPFVTY